MPTGKKKEKELKETPKEELEVIPPELADRTVVYTTGETSGMTLMRAVSRESRKRMNTWWRLAMGAKADRELPIWWDEAAGAVCVPKPEDLKTILKSLKAAGFVAVEVDQEKFIHREYDQED